MNIEHEATAYSHEHEHESEDFTMQTLKQMYHLRNFWLNSQHKNPEPTIYPLKFMETLLPELKDPKSRNEYLASITQKVSSSRVPIEYHADAVTLILATTSINGTLPAVHHVAQMRQVPTKEILQQIHSMLGTMKSRPAAGDALYKSWYNMNPLPLKEATPKEKMRFYRKSGRRPKIDKSAAITHWQVKKDERFEGGVFERKLHIITSPRYIKDILTPTEFKFISLRNQGLTIQEIAKIAGLSEHHVNKILQKCRNKVETSRLVPADIVAVHTIKDSSAHNAARNGRIKIASFWGKPYTTERLIDRYIHFRKRALDQELMSKGYVPLANATTPDIYEKVRRVEKVFRKYIVKQGDVLYVQPGDLEVCRSIIERQEEAEASLTKQHLPLSYYITNSITTTERGRLLYAISRGYLPAIKTTCGCYVTQQDYDRYKESNGTKRYSEEQKT